MGESLPIESWATECTTDAKGNVLDFKKYSKDQRPTSFSLNQDVALHAQKLIEKGVDPQAAMDQAVKDFNDGKIESTEQPETQGLEANYLRALARATMGADLDTLSLDEITEIAALNPKRVMSFEQWKSALGK